MRFVRLDDVPKLQSIYSYYVDSTVVSFEIEAPDVEEFKRRVTSISQRDPYLVYCENDELLGYAYAHPAFERAAYAWCAETTVYVDPQARSRGIGRILYRRLVDYLSRQGYKILYAVVVAENEESCAFHLKNGFHRVALFPKAGFKLGRWLDVVWFERILGAFPSEPKRPISIKDVLKEGE